MNCTILSFRHRIRNSSPGGLRLRKLLFSHALNAESYTKEQALYNLYTGEGYELAISDVTSCIFNHCIAPSDV